MMELLQTCFQNDGYCAHEMSIFEIPKGEDGVFFSKQPSDIRRIKPLLKNDHHLFSIYMVRDTRSVITSIHKNFPNMYFCNFRIWNECNSIARKLIQHPRFLQVKYEDLVTNPNKVQESIHNKFTFLEKKYDFSAYHDIASPSSEAEAAMGGVRKVSSDRVGAWNRHLPRIKYEYENHPDMADILVELGYENNKEWLKDLINVSPAKGQCRYPDHANKFKYAESKIRNGLKTLKYIIFTRFKSLH